MNTKLIILTIFALLLAFAVFKFSQPKTVTAPILENSSDTPEVEEKPITDSSFKTHTNETFNVTYKYSADWKGPEIYENADGFRFEIGTDTVYPYGTGREDRIYTVANSYYIVAQYNKSNESMSKDEFNKIRALKDGEQIEDQRSLLIKVKNIDENGLTGVEYISTLSATAQTEPYYVREVLLFNSNNDSLRITGSAENIDITNWKTAYADVDEKYLEEFRSFVNSAEF